MDIVFTSHEQPSSGPWLTTQLQYVSFISLIKCGFFFKGVERKNTSGPKKDGLIATDCNNYSRFFSEIQLCISNVLYVSIDILDRLSVSQSSKLHTLKHVLHAHARTR